MLDFSLSELAVIGTIALVVLGPERLPSAARTAGRWVGKARRFATQMQQELTSQLDTEELRREMSDHQRLLDEQMQETRQALAQVQRDTHHALTDAAADSTKPVSTVAATPHDHDEVPPWRPAASTLAPTLPMQDAPRPLIAASALRPTSCSDNSAATTTRNADDS